MMKRGAFLFVVVAFAILSGFVFYLDSFLDCGSVVCLKNYITGNVIYENQVLTGNVVYSSGNENEVRKFFENIIEVIIGPFVEDEGLEGSGESVLLGPGDIMVPGNEWSGVTATPSAVGNSGIQGFTARVIAHWDIVPWQDLRGSDSINVGVMAYHFNGIEKVSFSVDNGPWIDVLTPSLNPQTGVVEYWAVLNASSFGSSIETAEVRAIAYPLIAGQTKVLQGNAPLDHDNSMIFNINPSANAIRYVSMSGSDSNNCLTPATSCLTITRGINTIGSNLDGGEIRLGQGTWNLSSVSGVNTVNRWFTITSAPGTNPNNVLLNGMNPASSTGLYVKHLKIFNLSLIYPPTDLGGESYTWFDDIRAYYLNSSLIFNWNCPSGEWMGGFPSNGRKGYFTDSSIDYSCASAYGFVLIRNLFSNYTGLGWAGSSTVINYTVKSIEGTLASQGGADYHGDIFPFQDGDTIIYGGGTVPGGDIEARGFADIANGGNIDDVAIDGVNINIGSQWVFSICNGANHWVIKDTNLVGSAGWCRETGTTVNLGSMSDIKIIDSTFITPWGNIVGPWTPAGQIIGPPTVTYVNSSSNSPIAPSGLNVSLAAISSLTLNWSDNSNNEINFTLQRRIGTSGTFTNIANLPTNTISYIDSGLVSNTIYQYQIRSNNNAGSSAFSNIASGTTLQNSGAQQTMSIDEPNNNIEYLSNSFPVNFIVLLSVANGSVKFSLNNGSTNTTMINTTSTQFEYSQSSLAVGNYTFIAYANFTNGTRIQDYANFSVVNNSNSSSPGTTSSSNSGSNSGSGSGSNSGSGSGNSGSGSSGLTSIQCNDNLDNDGDELIDFPTDPGCVSLNDDNELDSDPLEGIDISDSEEDILSGSAESKLRIVFWGVLFILILAIILIGIIIASHVHKRKKFQEYVRTANKN